MKNILLIAITVLVTTGAFAQALKEVKSETKYCCAKCDQCASKPGTCLHHKTALVMEGKYYCPMHSDVTSDKPGKCSKCGMAMKRMEMETVTKYCCPKCDWTIPSVKGQCPHSTEAIMKDGELKCAYCHDKEGKCPKCGMEMEKVVIKKKSNNAKQVTYYCPMHPEVTSDKSGSCPKCGMNLMEKK